MSALNFQVSIPDTSMATTGTTVAVFTAPANQRVKIKGLSVFGKGTSNTDTPVKIEILYCSAVSGGTAGTAGTNYYVNKMDLSLPETIQTTISGAYTVEPTTYTITSKLQTWDCHPQTGVAIFFPLHDEIVIKGGGIVTVRLTAGNTAETMSVVITLEE